MLVDPEDLKLSNKLLNLQEKLLLEKSELDKNYKDNNSDTIEALLILRTNISIFKEKYKNVPYLLKHNRIMSDLIKTFPNANQNNLLKLLRQYRFYSEQDLIKAYSIFIPTILALVNFIFFLDLAWYNLLLVLVTEMSFFGSLLYLILINLTISTYRKEE